MLQLADLTAMPIINNYDLKKRFRTSLNAQFSGVRELFRVLSCPYYHGCGLFEDERLPVVTSRANGNRMFKDKPIRYRANTAAV